MSCQRRWESLANVDTSHEGGGGGPGPTTRPIVRSLDLQVTSAGCHIQPHRNSHYQSPIQLQPHWLLVVAHHLKTHHVRHSTSEFDRSDDLFLLQRSMGRVCDDDNNDNHNHNHKQQQQQQQS